MYKRLLEIFKAIIGGLKSALKTNLIVFGKSSTKLNSKYSSLITIIFVIIIFNLSVGKLLETIAT